MNDKTFKLNITPSQWTNCGTFTICALFFFLVVPLFYALWRYLVVKNQRFILDSNTLTIHSGVLNKKIDDVELYRIKDIQLERPLLMRMVGLGHLDLVTSDQTNPHVTIQGIYYSENIRVKLRELIENSRQRRGVRELETF